MVWFPVTKIYSDALELLFAREKKLLRGTLLAVRLWHHELQIDAIEIKFSQCSLANFASSKFWKTG